MFENPTSKLVNISKAHSAPSNLKLFLSQKKKERKFSFCNFYLRLLRTNAAAIATTIMTAAPIARYVLVGIPLVGCGAMLGEAEVVCAGDEVGAVVWVGVDVGTTAGDAAAGTVTNIVTACEL
jgi:hypothetical protein